MLLLKTAIQKATLARRASGQFSHEVEVAVLLPDGSVLEVRDVFMRPHPRTGINTVIFDTREMVP